MGVAGRFFVQLFGTTLCDFGAIMRWWLAVCSGSSSAFGYLLPSLARGFPSRVYPFARYPVASTPARLPPRPPFRGSGRGGVGRWRLGCARMPVLGFGWRWSVGLHGSSSGVLQRHTFLLLVQSATVGVMDRCLWPRRGARRYAGGVSAARYACSLGYPLPGDVIEFRPPTPPGPVGVEGGGDGGCTQGAWVTNPGPHQVDSAKKGFRSGESALCSSPCSALARRKALPMRSCRWFWTKFAYSCLQSGGGEFCLGCCKELHAVDSHFLVPGI